MAATVGRAAAGVATADRAEGSERLSAQGRVRTCTRPGISKLHSSVTKRPPLPWKALATGVLAPLGIGACVYLFLRPNEAWFLARLGGDVSAIRRLRELTVPMGAHVPQLVLDVVPDLAWAFAAGALLSIAWRGSDRRPRIAWCAVGAVVTVGYEVAQTWHLVPGTFDPYDVAAQAGGYALGWIVHARRGGTK